MSLATSWPGPVHYPESDGAPMGESGVHVLALLDLVHQLRFHFADQPDVHVAANLFSYFQEGDPRQVVCPDVFVCRGVPRDPPLPVWKTWEHGDRLADAVFEITSKSTRWIDQGAKRGLYEVLGVTELFLFDPEASYLKPPLQGFRLHRGRYRPIAPVGGRLECESLGLTFAHGAGVLDATTREGVTLPHLDEVVAALGTASEALRATREERDQLRAEIALLRAKGTGNA